MTTWHTKESARALWLDAESIPDPLLDTLLDVAREQVVAYAPHSPFTPSPEDPEDEGVPRTYAYAQLRQTQNLYNAGRVDSSGGLGDGSDFVIRPFPLDWHVKAMLRPTRGRPRVR